MQLDRNNTIILIVVAVAILLAAFYFFNSGIHFGGSVQAQAGVEADIKETYENQEAVADGFVSNTNPMPVAEPTGVQEEVPEVQEDLTNPSTCYPKDTLSPEELLPQDYSSTWAKCNPTGAGSLDGKNFLDAGHHIGINTVGQTLRNANLQLRSEPPNPQVKVSPFLNSTITPDTNRRYFEVGSC